MTKKTLVYSFMLLGLLQLTIQSSFAKQRYPIKKVLGIDSVRLDTIGIYGIHQLLQNASEKLVVINIWATWCGPCVAEFPDFVVLNKQYKGPGFEWITISADDTRNPKKVLKFLQKHAGEGTNYLFNNNDKVLLITSIDPQWQGAIPYTMVLAPGGKVLYAQQGMIVPAELKKIFDDYFANQQKH